MIITNYPTIAKRVPGVPVLGGTAPSFAGTDHGSSVHHQRAQTRYQEKQQDERHRLVDWLTTDITNGQQPIAVRPLDA